MSIKIGDRNKFKNSNVGHIYSTPPKKKGFASKHPIITGFITSFIVGFILLFSFWNKLVNWIEELF
ncbi:hypothetical protein GCM10008983_28060 [Lentibacillus halophilus]|uniref:Uncharacterized protein n=1 Tax=Lentibacillus halophilus TaxID=295065 RepID=A0ABN0ZI94_9BACI